MRINLKNIYIYAHIIIPIILSSITLINIENFLILPYVVLSILSIAVISINSRTTFIKNSPKFLYLFSMLVVLGSWFKYSIYKIFKLSELREPIGGFALGSPLESEVLWTFSIGILALFTCSILFSFLPNIRTQSNVDFKPKLSAALLTLILTALFAYINLKFNILLLAIKPDVILPLKGNVMFYLLITRALPFVFLFYCLQRFNLFYIFVGSLIFSISSIGVLSRVGILIYFLVILLLTLKHISKWNLNEFVRNISSIAIIFIFSTYLTVSVATGARDYFFSNANTESVKLNDNAIREVIIKSTNPDKFKMLKDLAIGRWIGLEGVMAVVAYPNKGFRLINEAFKEESYHGDSFYSKILNIKNSSTSKIVSTSIPGPIAFFYYSGSKTIVFVTMLITPLIFVFIEKGLISLYGSFNSALAMVVSFFAIDYHQFGIAPLAFFKYCLFTIVCTAGFGILINLKAIKIYLTQYSWPIGKN